MLSTVCKSFYKYHPRNNMHIEFPHSCKECYIQKNNCLNSSPEKVDNLTYRKAKLPWNMLYYFLKYLKENILHQEEFENAYPVHRYHWFVFTPKQSMKQHSEGSYLRSVHPFLVASHHIFFIVLFHV